MSRAAERPERDGEPEPDGLDEDERERRKQIHDTLTPEVPVPLDTGRAERRRAQLGVILVLSAAAAFLLVRMLWPFLTAIIGATVLAVLFFPMHRRLLAGLRRPTLAAFVGTTLLFFLVFLPVAGLSIALFYSIEDNVAAFARQIRQALAPEGDVDTWLSALAARFGIEAPSVSETMDEQSGTLGAFLAGRTVGVVSGLGGAAIQAGVALFTLYYLLRDGEALLAAFRRIIPLDDELTDTLVARANEIIGATMFGNVMVGIAQGVLGGLTFWLLDIPGAVLWGSVMGILGLLPILGTPLVWGPAAVILLLDGEVARALILIAAGSLIVSTIDNVLRATVVSDRAQLHPLVVFFSALGGVILFGMVGIFLGPILFVLSISFLEIARMVLHPDGRAGRA